MKTMITALTLVLLAATPTLAANSHAKRLREGRASAYLPQSGSYGAADTSRDGQIRAF